MTAMTMTATPTATQHEIEEWAREHDLPYFDEQVHFPDVRIEYEDADGRWDHVDVEVVTVHYRGAHGAAASRSGFSCYGGSSARAGGNSGTWWPCRGDVAMNFDDRVKAVSRIRLHGAAGALPGHRHAARRACACRVSTRSSPARRTATRSASSSTSSSRRQHATVCGCLHNRAQLYHVKHHALYRAIDQPHSRYRRPVSARQVIERLMRLDGVVLFPELAYLATEEEKVAFFSMMAPSLPRERLPHITVGQRTFTARAALSGGSADRASPQRVAWCSRTSSQLATSRSSEPSSNATPTCFARCLDGPFALVFPKQIGGVDRCVRRRGATRVDEHACDPRR